MLRRSDFTYHLPDGRIAQTPTVPRDSSRLLVLNPESGEIGHHIFRDLPGLLTPNDVLVRNNTKVIPARLLGTKTTGGHVELLLIKRASLTADQETWECLTKPGLKIGQVVTFAHSDLTGTCIEMRGYIRLVTFNLAHSHFFSALEKIGQTPLPPYIHWTKDDPEELRRLYQTTFAKHEGSAAAPTAGLHFTPELDEKIRAAGVQIEEITLHVGLGTFLRVKVDDITKHQMHSEWFTLTPEVAERLNQAKNAGKRIISVGTTTTRVLETCAAESTEEPGTYQLQPQTGQTDIYIYPPYQFKFVDSLITNYHEPQSTLIMLVSALASAPNTTHSFTNFGETTVGKAYQAAIDQQYRFLSFGDAMWIE